MNASQDRMMSKICMDMLFNINSSKTKFAYECRQISGYSVHRKAFSCAAVPFKGRNIVIAATKHSTFEIAFRAIGMGAEG